MKIVKKIILAATVCTAIIAAIGQFQSEETQFHWQGFALADSLQS